MNNDYASSCSYNDVQATNQSARSPEPTKTNLYNDKSNTDALTTYLSLYPVFLSSFPNG